MLLYSIQVQKEYLLISLLRVMRELILKLLREFNLQMMFNKVVLYSKASMKEVNKASPGSRPYKNKNARVLANLFGCFSNLHNHLTYLIQQVQLHELLVGLDGLSDGSQTSMINLE
jgi:hypothetical protein